MSYSILTLFDIILVSTLLWLGWRLLASEDIFKAVVLFISFGLLMALAWVRMRAPDVALAEAALGSGLTGPLFLAALRRMNRSHKGERRLDIDEDRTGEREKNKKSHRRLDLFQKLFSILVFFLTVLFGVIFYTIPENPPLLTAAVASLQNKSGVESPVTAVLLNFRGYDTLLEVMVLLVAVIGVWSLTKASSFVHATDISPVQMGVVRLLAPLMCLVAAYLVWQGGHLAGGAFQGGAILGAAGVLLLISEIPWLYTAPVSFLRIGLVLGPFFFTGIALCCLFLSGDLLAYPNGTAAWLILLIETFCAVSIGLTLALLFAGGRPEEYPPSGDIS